MSWKSNLYLATAHHLPKCQLTVIKSFRQIPGPGCPGLNRGSDYSSDRILRAISDYHLSDNRDTMANSALRVSAHKRGVAGHSIDGSEIVWGGLRNGVLDRGRAARSVASCSRQRRQTWKPHSQRSQCASCTRRGSKLSVDG